MENEGQPVEGQQEIARPETNESEAPVNTETQATQETPKAEGEEQAKKPRFQERISELVRQREEARRQSAYLLEQLQSLQKPQQPQQQAPSEGRPDPNKYESHYEYVEALTDWKLEQRLTKERESSKRQSEQQARSKAISTFQAKETEAHTKYEDYEEVTRNPDLHISPVMAHTFMESDTGPDILYYLGNNPKEAARIASLPPLSQIREIGKLESKLSSVPQKPKASSAPDPISPVGQKASATKSPENMTDEEWMKWREDQLRSKRKQR